jgi:hypothetical protein
MISHPVYAARDSINRTKKVYQNPPYSSVQVKMEEHIPPHHFAVADSETLDMAQLSPNTQLSELIELACRWNKSFGIDLGNVEIRVLLKEP